MKKFVLVWMILVTFRFVGVGQNMDSLTIRPDSVASVSIVDSVGSEPDLLHEQDTLALPIAPEAILPYATVYVYRPRSLYGAMVGYDLHLNNEEVCRITNNCFYELRVDKEGLVEVWAKTEKKVSVPLDVKFGGRYYVKCGIKMGAVVGRPVLTPVDESFGKSEYDKMVEDDRQAATKGKK